MIKNDTNDAFGRFFMPDILSWIKNEVKPEDVFDTDQLRQWAENNNYVDASEQRMSVIGASIKQFAKARC